MRKNVKAKQKMPELNGINNILPALVEDAETKLVLAEIQGKIIDKLAYSFVSKNATVEGLTFWGLLSCAEKSKVNKWSPEWTKPEYEHLEGDSMLLTIGCKNPKTKHTEWGNCVFFPKARFSERVAMTNAKRYALDKHISIPQKIAFIQYLKKHKSEMLLTNQSKELLPDKTRFSVSEAGKVKTERVVL